MDSDDLFVLAEDIKQNGLLDEITLFDGQVLDGWHRYQGCLIAGVKPRYSEYTGDDPGGFARSKNGTGRFDTPSMRAMAIVKINAWNERCRLADKPAPGAGLSEKPKTEKEMASEAGVSERTIRHAKTAEKNGLGDAVLSGEISAKAAAEAGKEKSKTKKQTALDKAKAEIQKLREFNEELAESNANLLSIIEAYDTAQLDEDERVIKIKGYQAKLDALSSQLNEQMHLTNEWKREALALRKRVAT